MASTAAVGLIVHLFSVFGAPQVQYTVYTVYKADLFLFSCL